MPLFTAVVALDAVLDAHAAQLGDAYTGYRNHTYRVVNFCVALLPDGEAELEKIAIATAFHDLGIWTDGTFDYVPPSVRLASRYLEETGREEWLAEVRAMIEEHHKLSRWTGEGGRLVEAFREADAIDLSLGLVRFGLSRATVRAILLQWPNAGFHATLVRLAIRRFAGHPLSPLPMVRW